MVVSPVLRNRDFPRGRECCLEFRYESVVDYRVRYDVVGEYRHSVPGSISSCCENGERFIRDIFDSRYDVAFSGVGIEKLVEDCFAFGFISSFIDGFFDSGYLFNTSLESY
jgi:hypothetical protein